MIVEVSHFFYFRKKLPYVKFDYYERMSHNQHCPNIKYFNDFTWFYLLRPSSLPSHLFSNTPIIMNKKVLSLCVKTAAQILYCHFLYKHISIFPLYKKCILFKIHQFLKEKFSHIRWSNPFAKWVVLKPQFYLTQSPAMTSNQKQLQFLV